MDILQPPSLKIDALLYTNGQKMLPRCRIERRVVWNLLAHLKAAGFCPTATDDGAERIETETPEEVMEAAFNLDECWVLFQRENDSVECWVRLVFGNDGWDCVSDWSDDSATTRDFSAAMDAFDPENFV